MTAWNSLPYLHRAIQSVLAQEGVDFELIILDDGSPDLSWGVIQDYANRDSRIRAFRQQNMGMSAALNRAISFAKSEYILNCDADDVLLPGCLAAQLAYMQANPFVVGLGCLAQFINEKNETFWSEKNPFLTRADYERAMAAGDVIYVRHTGFIVRKDIFDQTGGYRFVPQSNDIDLFNRLADHGPVLCNPLVLVQYRIRLGQETTSYKNILEPRLTWAWIGACRQARRNGLAEPERQAFIREFSSWPWRKRLPFWLNAMSQGLFYEAKVDFISRNPRFLWKGLQAMFFSPLLIYKRLYHRLLGRALITH